MKRVPCRKGEAPEASWKLLRAVRRSYKYKSHRFKASSSFFFYFILGCSFLYIKKCCCKPLPELHQPQSIRWRKRPVGPDAKGARKIYAIWASGSLLPVITEKTNACKHPYSKALMCSATLSTAAAVLLLQGVLPGTAAAECFFQGFVHCKEQWEKRVLLPPNQAKAMIKTSSFSVIVPKGGSNCFYTGMWLHLHCHPSSIHHLAEAVHCTLFWFDLVSTPRITKS